MVEKAEEPQAEVVAEEPKPQPRPRRNEDIAQLASLKDREIAAERNRAQTAEQALADAQRRLALLGDDGDAVAAAERVARAEAELRRREDRVSVVERDMTARLLAAQYGLSHEELMDYNSPEAMESAARAYRIRQLESELSKRSAPTTSAAPEPEAPESVGHDVGGQSLFGSKTPFEMTDEEFDRFRAEQRSQATRRRAAQ